MPAPAQPPPPPPQPQNVVRSAGKQEDFHPAARALAESLGWFGPDENVTVGIRVDDARNYIAKVMHEHYQAAAKGEPQPDYLAACEHLSVDNPDEQAAIDTALLAAYEAGKGAEVTEHERVVKDLGAAHLELDGDTIAASLTKKGA